ncbi:CDP-diacylglycerol--serine O-phosphatidyltransferase [Fibrella sp. HMF5036]|uniref:CDP-diacylglycerol--serine O-phosphatidyltransferase n=2 Tax=Fibrella aquatilis TaxID=2817059 RepID=A0A939JZQ5_9BACT|nr:CDP-diacylglycerol--serine O-phosphatidyltransferase [Fibrella aquatilis]
MTCGNLLCGCIGILFTMRGDLVTAAWLIVLAGILDFGDGFVARAVGASGPFGKELDSLADVVTFGVLPSFILLALLQGSFLPSSALTITGVDTASFWPYLAFSIAVCGALRLARFNIDTRQTEQFLGLPIPANALFVASLPMIVAMQPQYESLVLNPFVLYGTIIGLSLLMVSELPLMAFKFKSFGWAENKVKYSFLLASILLLFLLQFAAIPLIILLYIFLSISINRKTKRMYNE